MKRGTNLGLALVLAAGGVLGTIAVRARERTYVVPVTPASVPLVLSGTVPDGCVVRAFDVEGICCQGCSGKLHGALSAVAGVEEVAVDPLAHVVSAVVRADVPEAQLETALTFDKYSVRPR